MNNKACCWVLIILIAGGVLSMVVTGILIGSFMAGVGKETAVSRHSFLMIELSGFVPEHRSSPQFEVWLREQPTISQLLYCLEQADDDPRIVGVVLRPWGTMGFAELRELREAVSRFKESGKPVYAYLEMATDRDYYLASMADTIAITPSRSGGLIMLGLSASNTYLAKTFRKVGIEFHVLHTGKYKGAYENLDSEAMSGPLRESLQSLLDDLFKTYTGEIADARPQIGKEALEKMLLQPDRLVIGGEEAVQAGIADLAMDWGDFRDRIRAGDEFRGISPAKYARSRTSAEFGDEIAVVFAGGSISYGDGDDPWGDGDDIESGDMVKLLRELREDESVKAVVLRVNSPGGSSLASDIILQELKRLKHKKPVVVSMGNVAASGGYYISCAASEIIAQPNTITGSIGVVSVIPSAKDLYEKIGARVETVEKGYWDQFFRLDKEFTPEHEKVILEFMDGVYDEFLTHVADGRGLSKAQVEESAQGRVWTGIQARERGLVDGLGGLDFALDRACDLAGVDRESVAVERYPHPRGLLEFVLNQLETKVRMIQSRLLVPYDDPDMRRALDFLTKFNRQREYVQMLMPIEVP
ncbi:signal peptide peptidase SppA [bacterium]|nr:signal peptide peptidase SppA [bacterium]MBU1984052.1 signal peptide peptidase SppA [bacterium]